MTEVICQQIFQNNSIFLPHKNFDAKDFILESIIENWPKETSKPIMSYFDTIIGPSSSNFFPYELPADSNIVHNTISYSLESFEKNLPILIRSYKNKFIISSTFEVPNKYEKRGNVSIYSLITICDKKDFFEKDLEEKIIMSTNEIKNMINLYINRGFKIGKE
jgi:hypothetical protein